MEKSFESKVELFENRLYDQHIKVPTEVFEYYKRHKVVRFIARINDSDEFPCAILSAGIDGKYLIVSNDLKKRNNLSIGESVKVTLVPDNSKYGMPLPLELNELLQQDAQFELYFEQLTPGRQRALIHLVAKLKSTNKRLEKSIIISQHLIEERGVLDFKLLNERFKKGI